MPAVPPCVLWPSGRPPGWGAPVKDLPGRDVVVPRLNVTICVLDAQTGRLLHRERGHNLVTVAGRNQIRDLLYAAGAGTPITHFAIGTGSTAVAAADTALVAEVQREEVSQFTAASQLLTIAYFLPSTDLNGQTLREAGLFNASAAGTMHARYVFATAISKTSSIAVTFTWELEWKALDILEVQHVELGGDSNSFVIPASSDAYPAGATLNKIVPGSGLWLVDSASLTTGTFVLEAIAKVQSAGARAKVCLVNLDEGAPDTALVGSEITFTADETVGERKRSSTITFPTAGTARQLAAKVTCNSTSIGAAAWGIRIVRTG